MALTLNDFVSKNNLSGFMTKIENRNNTSATEEFKVK